MSEKIGEKQNKMNLVKSKLPTPVKGAIFYEDNDLYACLANNPIVNGHCIIVWKKNIEDIHLLDKNDYEKLMNIVDKVRDALLKTMKTDKIYLIYMDEIKHVHWHLIPRTGGDSGFTLLEHEPQQLTDTDLAEKIKNNLE